ncbi:AAA family ATPase [Paenibacillus sp. SZ31]|uniref:hypothetical protein n=1 Tax=Paenibacillus sp. SZ31 TaxID=2725555 RepID=UPI00146CD53D|nr:hypothetical protein [Paenibacillus sp. SZ31]NMI07775.1 AAA family ATPase [Paenibacillus sp. SZ31]
MTFKTSVNIKFDIGNTVFIKRYISTPSHAEAINGIIEGFIKEDANRAHILVGPYGTGKSLLANIIASMVSKSVSSEDVNSLVNKFIQVDDSTAHHISEVSQLERRYLPIILSGDEGRFRQSILSNLLKKLHEENIHVTLPGVSSKVIETITSWKQSFPETYNLFHTRLLSEGKEIEPWITEINKQNEKEISYFSELYSQLTSGASFDIDYNQSFITQIEYVLKILHENNIGVFIVYDEFARFLQGLNDSKFNEAMQDIQDLAEIANRNELIHLLLVTHKGLRQYFSGLGEEAISEFQRIEKRFRQYFIKNDQATFLRLAEIVISENLENKPEISNELFEYSRDKLREYTLFPSLNQTEKEKLILKGMYPLHPVSLFMLPQLTSVFGQNERTLFTFLESQDSGGFHNHIKKTNNYYLPHQLFDYFFPDSRDITSEELAGHFLLLKKAIARIPSDLLQQELAINLIKFVSLWNICGLQSEVRLTDEFISFVFNGNNADLESVIQILSDNKILRYNRVSNYWELFAGNSVNLQERIESDKASLQINKKIQKEIMFRNLSKKYYFPQQYNDTKGMTRFASVQFVCDLDIPDYKSIVGEQVADLTIQYLLLGSDYHNNEKFEEILKISKESGTLLYLHSKPLVVIQEELKNIFVLEQLLKNKAFIEEDKGIKEEIILLLNESKFMVSDYLDEIDTFSKDSWYYNGEKLSFINDVTLGDFLSEKCHELFRYTPVILNDSFNRTIISSPQKNGAIKLIDLMMEKPRFERFGIEGNGPEYSIYASVFKNNGRFDLNINNAEFQNIQYEPYAVLRQRLIELLDHKPYGEFKDIINLFTDSPFGIRKPVVPVLLVAMLSDRLSEFMLYSNDMFVPGLNGNKLFEIIVEIGAGQYQYKYERIDEKHIDFYRKIEVEFSNSTEGRLVNKSRTIFIAGTLLKWYRTLPRYTQLSNNVDDQFSWFRECIRRSEISPQESMKILFDKYYDEFDNMVSLKDYGESRINVLGKQLEDNICSILGVNNFNELSGWLGKHDLNKNPRNNLLNSLNRALHNESDLESGWLIRFVEMYVGVRLEDWSDATYDILINQLNQDILAHDTQEDLIKTDEGIPVQIGHSKKIINEVDLSVKSKVMYDNLDRLISVTKKSVSRQELEFVVYKIFEKYVSDME